MGRALTRAGNTTPPVRIRPPHRRRATLPALVLPARVLHARGAPARVLRALDGSPRARILLRPSGHNVYRENRVAEEAVGAVDENRREGMPWGPLAPWDWGQLWPGFVRRLWEAGAPWEAGYPAVDLYERGDEVVVEAELPGIDPEDIDVEVSDHHLVIRGQTRRATEEENRGIYRRERRFGAFVRSVALPEDVDVDRAAASYHQGVLEVRLPKKEGRRRRIAVQRQG